MILVTGASGAVGSRLVERLIAEGERPVTAGRRPDVLLQRFPELEARELDALRPETLAPALEGADVLYYFIHSMEPGTTRFDERDRAAALNVARVAGDRGVERVVYLGWLGADDEEPSPSRASRHEIGRILAAEGPPLVELRSAMVVGSRSASYRMLADLVERLPAQVLPRWTGTRTQPIAIDDVVSYLSRARTLAAAARRIPLEVGGADVVTFREMIETFARVRGKRRLLVRVPMRATGLSALWCGLATSVSRSVAKPLILGLTHESVVTDDTAAQVFPEIRPMGLEDALRRAMEGA